MLSKVKVLSIALLLLSLSLSCLAGVSTELTNIDVLDNGKSLYGEKVNGQGAQLSGINSDDAVIIDEDGLGVIYGGTNEFNSVIVDDFIEIDPATTVDTSATTNATVTLLGSYQIIDTHQDVSISTVNAITTASIGIGTEVTFQTAADARDVVFIETGNLSLGGTRTLNDADDVLILMKTAADKFIEKSFVDNN